MPTLSRYNNQKPVRGDVGIAPYNIITHIINKQKITIISVNGKSTVQKPQFKINNISTKTKNQTENPSDFFISYFHFNPIYNH